MAGYLWVAGSNFYGQLGVNLTFADRSSPVQTITGGNDWSYISKKQELSSAAIKSDGTLWLWGNNQFGQLGDFSIVHRSSPVQTISGGTDWVSVCSNNHTVALKKDGTLWLWGANYGGNLGNNNTLNCSSPIQTIAYGTDWSSISCGYRTTFALKTDGTLWSWGSNFYGQLGDNTSISKSSPIQLIPGTNDWSKISSGTDYAFAVKSDGTLWGWGNNITGQLGDNTTTHRSSPVQTISGGTDWHDVSCGGNSVDGGFTAAIKKDGTLWTWGLNIHGQLGINSTTNQSSPIQVITLGTDWASVATGFGHMAATKNDGTLWLWGFGQSGKLANNSITSVSSPVQTVMPFYTWKSVGLGSSHTLAINSPLTLQLTTPIAQAYSGAVFGTQPVISFLDESSNVDTTVSLPVTVSVTSGNATLSGTTTVNASSGVATFTDLKLTGFGQVTLTFASSAGITSVSQTLVLEIPAAVMPKRSETASSIPTSGQLKVGELAINIADRKGYVKKSDGTIVNVFSALSSGAITSGVVGDAAVLSGNIASGQIGTNHLASGVLSSITLSSGQVTSGTIASGSVSQFKLSSGAVNSGQIGNNAVVSGSIASGSIGQFAIASGSITAEHIASGAVINADIADAAVTSGKIASGAIGTLHISSGGVQNVNIASGAVTSGNIASGQIGAFHLASGVGGGGGTPGGTSGMLQYNFNNTFGPTSGLTYSVTSGTPLVQATSQTAFNANFAVKASSGQVSNLTEWKNTSGSNLAYMDVSGNFFAVSKSFLIDHPTIRGKKLRHVSLEGPAADVFFRGSSVERFISIPKYWINLVDFNSISVTLTARNKQQNLFVEKVEGDKIYIGGDENPDYYYVVYGERMDIPKVVVEE